MKDSVVTAYKYDRGTENSNKSQANQRRIAQVAQAREDIRAERAASAARSAALSGALINAGNSMQTKPAPLRQSTHCTTRDVSGTVVTDCN